MITHIDTCNVVLSGYATVTYIDSLTWSMWIYHG
ncbi:hypothetical protein F383_25100 [Gossypium arboreum]|uniref:Uncharacterized protein n=1 Tax=Gossypium arboreum TaxID=29729 RepID=A0A0B0P6E3_GOSAR|nr:hypothetical protein F383_25100 [Gossypium arboreum]